MPFGAGGLDGGRNDSDGPMHSIIWIGLHHSLRSSKVSYSSLRCSVLSQMQKVVRVEDAAGSIVGLLALRLDEQGAELSTPWPPEPG